jgi:uncharacterized protein (TIGR03382 family)
MSDGFRFVAAGTSPDPNESLDEVDDLATADGGCCGTTGHPTSAALAFVVVLGLRRRRRHA